MCTTTTTSIDEEGCMETEIVKRLGTGLMYASGCNEPTRTTDRDKRDDDAKGYANEVTRNDKIRNKYIGLRETARMASASKRSL